MKDMLVIVVLHYLNVISRFSDMIFAVSGGEIKAVGISKEVIGKENLKTVFQIDARIVEEALNGYPVCLTYQLIKE